MVISWWLTLAEEADGVADEPPAVVLLDDVGGDDEHLAGAEGPRVLPHREQPVLPPRHQHQVRVPPRVLIRDLLQTPQPSLTFVRRPGRAASIDRSLINYMLNYLSDGGGGAGDEDDLVLHVLDGEGLDDPLHAAQEGERRPRERQHHHARRRHHQVQHRVHHLLHLDRSIDLSHTIQFLFLSTVQSNPIERMDQRNQPCLWFLGFLGGRPHEEVKKNREEEVKIKSLNEFANLVRTMSR